MGSITSIEKIGVIYLDKGAITTGDGNFLNFYLPNENISFCQGGIFERDKEYFDKTFIELDPENGNYLVNEPVVCFYYINNISLMNGFNDDDEGYYSLPCNLIWNDIKHDLKIDNNGEYRTVVNILYKTHWYQSYEGEWDCSEEYIGILNEYMDPEQIITKKSKENKKNFNEEFRHNH